MRILIVDDEESVRNVMVDLLGAVREMNPRLPKLHIHVAGNGALGGQKALAQDVDLIITDWMMPRMNGTKMTRAIRRQGFAGEIVMVSSAAGEKEAEALKAGVNRVYSKPITLATLEEIVLQARQDMLVRKSQESKS